MIQSIKEWRTELQQSEHIGADEMAELESHLIDEIEGLNTDLLSDQEKVMVASHRLGSSVTLNKAYQKNRVFDFQRISIFAQVLLGIMSFLAVSRICLTFGLMIQQSLGWTDSLSLVTMYYGFQLLAAIGFFLLTRHWLQMSLKKKKTVRANLYGLGTTMASYGLFLVLMRFANLSFIMNVPVFLSAFSSTIFTLFLIGFLINTIRIGIRQRKALLAT